MSNTNITLKKLAEKLGVSISTISKALNDSHEISDTTKIKIKELAKRYNYQPNKMALNLKFGKTNTIGVVLPSIQNFFFAQVLFGIENIIAKSDYNMIVSITNESLKKEVNNIKTLSNTVVDGFIIAVAEETQIKKSFSHLESVITNKKKLVLFDRVVESIKCDKVRINDLEAVYNATNMMIENGKKNIALVSTIHKLSVGALRTQGYMKSIKKNFNTIDESLIIECKSNLIEASLYRLLSTKKIDAIIALDEESSLFSLKTVKRIGYKIPDQIAIIGYAGEKMASNLSPELTTIDQHGVSIGEQAAKLMISKLDTNSKEIEEILIESTLNYRKTTAWSIS